MEISNKIASNITAYTKYSRFVDKESRRETWKETVYRSAFMHIQKYPQLVEKITKGFGYVEDKKILSSMRSLQFGGRAIELSNSRIYNCAYMACSYISFFSELMFLLLGGTGVGYSVQWRHISNLPAIKRPGKPRKFLIQDSIIGWADAVRSLVRAYLDGKYLPVFDYSDIRPAGTPLKTAGGKAPGPGPLRTCLAKIQGILESKPVGSKLQSYECSDLACFIADAVLSGGIRRSAMICIFDMDDDSMLGYKSGDWWELAPERGRVNVSAVAFRQDVYEEVGPELNNVGSSLLGITWRKPSDIGMKGDQFDTQLLTRKIADKTTKEQFDTYWKYVENSGSGEPGIYWSNHPDWGCNPCVEISLKHKQFCNLTTINFSVVQSQEELDELAYYAGFIGTLQAGYTDLHYLSEGWKENCDDEALLGVSVTGIADGGNYKRYNWQRASLQAKRANEETAKAIGIKSAARITCIKPEGTASLVLGTSSGIHARHSHYYIRRMRLGKSESVAQYLLQNHPALITQDLAKPEGLILELPQKSPDRSIYRSESPIELLDRVKFFHRNWILPGHISGENNHNVSCTVSIKPGEWAEVGEWLWGNRSSYNGVSVLPFDGGTYKQAPFEECDKETYDELMKSLTEVDLTQIVETEDLTTLREEPACAGGACTI
jgi:hypothetical protein